MSTVRVHRNNDPGVVVRRTLRVLDVEGVATWAGGRSTVATMSTAAQHLMTVRPEVELRKVVRSQGAVWEWSLPLPPADVVNLTDGATPST